MIAVYATIGCIHVIVKSCFAKGAHGARILK
jgi:hypothetical protein